MKKQEKKLNTKGITLVALVVTIVILLILAGISLNLTIGSNGIITRAVETKEANRYASVKDETDMWQINKNSDPNNPNTMSKDQFIESLGPTNKKLLSQEEVDEAKNTGKITIADKEIIFGSALTSITLNKTTATVVKDGTAQLTANEVTTEPLIWDSSDTSVATVSDGNVTAKATGTAVVTCKLAEDQTISAQCTVNVDDGSNIYAEGTTDTNGMSISFKNVPTDCQIALNDVYRGIQTDPGHIRLGMDKLREATPTLYDGDTDIEEGFYNDYYYQLKDSFGNLSDFYWFYGDFACFTANTKVLTSTGLANIQDIKAGDTVYSMNMDTNQVEIKKVLQTFKHTCLFDELCRVYVDNDYVECTTGHKIYTKNKGWMKAYYLEQGDIAVDNFDNEKVVSKVEHIKQNKDTTVYNFEVEDNHNYFVGNSKILVHNQPEISDCDITGVQYKGENIGK